MVAGKALAIGCTNEQPMVDGITKEQLVHIASGVAQDLPLTVRAEENNREIKE